MAAPLGVRVLEGRRTDAGFAATLRHEMANAKPLVMLRWPLQPDCEQRGLSLRTLLVSQFPLSVHLRIRSVALDTPQLGAAAATSKALRNGEAERVGLELSDETVDVLGNHVLALLLHDLEPWLRTPFGYRVSCEFSSSARIPLPLMELVASAVYGGRPCQITVGSGAATSEDVRVAESVPAPFDLRGALHATDAAGVDNLMPGVELLREIGFARHFSVPTLRLGRSGIVLGDSHSRAAAEPVRLTTEDRMRHCYLLGATGSGKSTLLLNMLTQDIAAGEGVCLIDPHGDLYQQTLERIPSERSADVVLIDATDFDRAVGINFLECNSKHRWAERNFIINELAQIFQRLYGSVPESMGPAFFQYMRNSLELLMHDPAGNVTLVDLPRVFEERDYRMYLREHCTDPLVKAFWGSIAEKTSGESSLANMAPYITNKFAEFIYNRLVRAIVGQSRSTIDFRAILAQRRILLVRLSKGLIGDRDARFLGMIILGKLVAAALARADSPAAQRHPFRVYVDECQNFTTETMASALAEGRKYGLALTLANQNLKQVDDKVLQTILANTGTKLFFRTSIDDAKCVEKYVSPLVAAEDLATMPDFHVAARMLAGAQPSPPFVFRTRQPACRVAASDRRIDVAAMIVQQSNESYTRGFGDVEAEIKARRAAYVTGAKVAA